MARATDLLVEGPQFLNAAAAAGHDDDVHVVALREQANRGGDLGRGALALDPGRER